MLVHNSAARRKTYRQLAAQQVFPDHESERLLMEFDASVATITAESLRKLVANGAQGTSPSYFLAWNKDDDEEKCHLLHRPLLRFVTAGEKNKDYFNTLFFLRGDVAENGDKPLAFPVDKYK